MAKVVLYFYPADASPGCTKQAKAFTDAIGEFKKAGATGMYPILYLCNLPNGSPQLSVYCTAKGRIV